MWLDIVVVAILAALVTLGYRNGFIYTFFHTLGWAVSLVLGLLLFPAVSTFLKFATGFYDALHLLVINRLSEEASSASGSILGELPALLQTGINTAVDAAAVSLADSITDLLFNIMSFLLIALIIKIIFRVIASLFSKRSNDGVVGFIDGVFGLVFGFFGGIMLVCFLLAALVLGTSLFHWEFIADALDNSILTGILYDYNVLFLKF